MVINNRLETSKKILRLLFDKNLHVNEIIRQTSLDRSYIISTIKTLEREGLIARNKGTKKGKEIVKQLTPLGKELAKLMDNIESYNKSYSELKYAIRENFSFNWSNIQDDSVLRNILRDRKWAEDDISRFINVDKHWGTAVHNFVSTSPWLVIRILLAKYSMIIFDYKPNQIAKSIVDKLIIDFMTEQLFSILDNVTNMQRRSMLYDTTSYIVADIQKQIGVFGLGNLFKDYRFMDGYIENVILAIFIILGPDRELIKQVRDFVKFNVKDNLRPETPQIYASLLEKVLTKLP
ncbi:MAG: winged helix-turn-helix transcriptional regulator [Nitrososphaeraceae archaeon]